MSDEKILFHIDAKFYQINILYFRLATKYKHVPSDFEDAMALFDLDGWSTLTTALLV